MTYSEIFPGVKGQKITHFITFVYRISHRYNPLGFILIAANLHDYRSVFVDTLLHLQWNSRFSSRMVDGDTNTVKVPLLEVHF